MLFVAVYELLSSSRKEARDERKTPWERREQNRAEMRMFRGACYIIWRKMRHKAFSIKCRVPYSLFRIFLFHSVVSSIALEPDTLYSCDTLKIFHWIHNEHNIGWVVKWITFRRQKSDCFICYAQLTIRSDWDCIRNLYLSLQPSLKEKVENGLFLFLL